MTEEKTPFVVDTVKLQSAGKEDLVTATRDSIQFSDPLKNSVNPKTGSGLRKPQINLVPPIAVVEEAKVFELGAKKYSPYNWRDSRVPSSIYYAAALRHLMAWFDGEDIDEESGISHLAHVRACMGILMDAKSCGTLADDRPVPGGTGKRIRELTEED